MQTERGLKTGRGDALECPTFGAFDCATARHVMTRARLRDTWQRGVPGRSNFVRVLVSSFVSRKAESHVISSILSSLAESSEVLKTARK